MHGIEWIRDGDEVLAVIVRADYSPGSTEFITPLDYKQQLGFIVYRTGEAVAPHMHRSLERNLSGTSEVLFVRSGAVEADLYNGGRKLVATRSLRAGDTILLVSGGHGFRMTEDTVLMEVKQGPYIGPDEKVRF